jgi:hypothetical protein
MIWSIIPNLSKANGRAVTEQIFTKEQVPLPTMADLVQIQDANRAELLTSTQCYDAYKEFHLTRRLREEMRRHHENDAEQDDGGDRRHSKSTPASASGDPSRLRAWQS